MREGHRVCVIGIGNPERGDDAVGHLVARRLRDDALPDVDVVEHDGEAGGLVELLRRAGSALLVDAGAFGAAPGTLRRLDATCEQVPATTSASSHGFGLAHAIELARALDLLPRRCLVYLIEGGSYALGAPLSSAVAAAIPQAAAQIRRDIATAARSVRRSRRGSGCSVPTGGTGETPARH